jgi:sialic acid synthase SpsE
MGIIILDISANTHKNNIDYLKLMIDELHKVDNHKYDVILKAQLFRSAGPNIVLDKNVFDFMYNYGKQLGYKVTSSVFDDDSLSFLLKYNPCFIKIANNPALYESVMREITVDTPVIVSWNKRRPQGINMKYMCCVSKYPAELSDYENQFSADDLKAGISDHTTNWDLYNKYKPDVYEVHYMLPDSTGNDSGPFARVPDQLKEILK